MKPEGEENRATAESYALDPMLFSNHARAKTKMEASHTLCSGRSQLTNWVPLAFSAAKWEKWKKSGKFKQKSKFSPGIFAPAEWHLKLKPVEGSKICYCCMQQMFP